MTQLALPLAPRRPVAAPVADTAARLLYRSAGEPGYPQLAPCPAPAPCYWCGLPVVARGRAVSTLADTFPSHHMAAAPSSPWLCAGCGWTLSDHVRLPASYARARIERMAEEGRRCQVAVGDADPERRLLLRLADGRVGLWATGPNAAAEAPWQEARDVLREEPADVGPCRYLGAVPLADLGDGPAKFRAFHHFGAEPGTWWACTDSDRAEIRAWLLDPPAAPWAGVIGDGKKSLTIRAHASPPAGQGLQCVSYLGASILYEPAALARQIAAWEALISAGAGDEEIASGRYGDRGLPLVLARRAHDPAIAPIRGGPTVGLVGYLRRGRKELAS